MLAAALHQAKEARLKILDVMKGAIAAPREEVRTSAPKIVSFEIPVDKIGEVIGPKGKVINTIQQETGADIAVTDADGMGVVSIGSKDGAAVTEARRRIELILDPPTAELGAEYTGKVVNITKFGAFVNILPGRDGLVHISKLGRGKRIDRVEDVLNLGDEVEVRVDDIDQNGKLSLSFADSEPAAPSGDGADNGSDGGERAEGSSGGDRGRRGDSSGVETVSFSDEWDAQAASEFGDLGPAPTAAGNRGEGGGDRRGGGGRRRSGGGGRRR